MSKLLTSQEMLSALRLGIRIQGRIAMDCSNHLAVHSSLTYAGALHDIAVRLDELADIVEEIAQAHGQ